MVFPTELRAKVASGHLANYIHLYCCLHTQFSMKKQLKDINDSAQFLKNLETNSRKASEQKISTKTDETENHRLNDEKLVKSVVELVQTEETFVKDLEQLMTRYVKPADLNFLDCVDKLQKTHSIFLNSLQDAGGDLLSTSAQTLDYTQIKDAVMRISALFINKCNKFKIYSEYSAAYLRFQHLCRVDQDLKGKLDQLNASGQHRESVESLLIKPIQRVLKYPLFLEQIRDFCLKDSMEQRQCLQALGRMQTLATYVNEMQRIHEEYGQRQCLQALGRMQTLATYVNEMQRIHEEYGVELERLAKLPELAKKNLWMDLRDLLMFSHLKWLQSGDRRHSECVAFVFSSLVLILGPESTSKKKQPRPYKIFPIREIQVNETIPDNLASSSDPNNPEHFFSITHSIPDSSETVYYVSCCHADIKTHFIKSVRRALKMYLKQKPRPISGSSQSDWGYASAH
uniref:DH domain-containing protein n=1 Tax=Panagrolaimus sp. JU765 TaxID=591449 RepID=A0AC34QP31_9BILA